MKSVCFFSLLRILHGGDLTCGTVKQLYKENACCGNTATTISTLKAAADCVTTVCAYSFEKPNCTNAGVQSPRDMTDDSVGNKNGTFFPMNDHQRKKLHVRNVHFHEGAEHRSANYNENNRRLAATTGEEHSHPNTEVDHEATSEHAHDENPVSGRNCAVDGGVYATDAYDFQWCQNVAVGKTYEVHWVHSSSYGTADLDEDESLLSDSLATAANGGGALNPFLAVQAQVFFIVSAMQDGTTESITPGEDVNMTAGWITSWAAEDSKLYAGSTTGPSHDNTVCSPYAVSWFVDRACHAISAQYFDEKFCKKLKEEDGLHVDLWPHGSRAVVDADFVVPWDEVEQFVVDGS